MKSKLKQKSKKLLTIVMSMLIMFGMIPATSLQAFAENGSRGALNPANITSYDLSIIDKTHGDAKIEYKKQGDSGYNDYLSNPSKFSQVVGKDQKVSEVYISFLANYSATERLKEGDTLEIPISLGTELKNASFADVPLKDGAGNVLGKYRYSAGKFILSFSGDYIKNTEVKNFTAALKSGSVSISNTTMGTGTNGEKVVMHGEVLGTPIIAGYEKKNAEAPVGPGPLSLDNVTINSFKIIDVANGNKEIDYRTSDSAEYNSFKNDPTKFDNAICENQKNSINKLQIAISYNGNKIIQEGDTLTIPMSHGAELKNFSSQKLFDGTNHELGIWEYKNGQIQIEFKGDYIKNHQVKQFSASFQTGEIKSYLSNGGKSMVLGDRKVIFGKLGKNDICVAREKLYVVAQYVETTKQIISKGAMSSTDKDINWRFDISNDYYKKDGKDYTFPYFLSHNGQYVSNSLTDIYIEDTFVGCANAPYISRVETSFTGIDDQGKIFSGAVPLSVPKSILTKINQDGKTKEQVRSVLKVGEYCIYNNGDGTYTVMLKWWNMNDSTGMTYNKLTPIIDAGGVGNYLKQVEPDLYGGLSNNTISKINQIYDNKALQNIFISVKGEYPPVKEITEVENTAKIVTKQTGEKDYPAVGRLTPPAGIADAPADPLAIKMLKTDKDTGENLSTGFKFVLQTSTDNGATWTDVSVNASMLEKGTLDGGQLVPDDKGTIQVKQLIGGNMYRFVEKTHAKPYRDVTINNAKPNDKNNTTSANSKAVKVTNQGKGHVIVMYNAKVKTSVNVEKKWEGPKKDSVKIQLLAGGKPVQGKTLTLSEAVQWKGAFKNLDKLDANGNEIKYDVAEVKIDGYTSTKTGSAANGFTITNKNTEKTKVKVTKKWEGPAKDSVTVKLLADGKEVSGKTLELKKAENWIGTFEDLPKYNKDGSEIKYDVAEVNIAFYDSVKSGDAKNGYVITNKHVPPKKEVFKGTTTTKIDGEVVQPGQELTYAITYKNTKDKDVTAEITDKLPKHTKFVSADNGGTEKDGVVTWKPEVKKGESITVKVVVKVEEDANGAPLDNKAKVNDGQNESTTNETHNFTPTEPVKEGLQFESTTKIDGKRVEPGQKITYAITYKNTTGKDVDATITDKIPAHTKFVSAEDGGKESGGVVTWKKKVAKGDAYVAIFTVQVDDDVNGQPIKNKAKVNDGKNESDTNEVTNPTPTRPEKEVFKGDTTTKIDGKVVKGGDELTYAVTYKNTTGEAVKATITDKLPAHTKFVSADNGGTESGDVVTWKADVADGKSITVKFKVKVYKDVNGAPLDNQAKVNDGTNTYNTNETHNPTPTEPKKEVFKSGTTTNIDGVRVKPDQKLTYAITYNNTTGEDRDVTITDKIPAHTTFVSADNGGKYAGGKVTWTKKVANGETFKVTFTVKVDKDVDGATLENTARVDDGVNDSNTNTVKNPTPKTPKVPNNPNNPSKPHGPRTGDDSNIMLLFMLLLASGGALGTTVYIRRKRQ